jgi:hypothetical protein
MTAPCPKGRRICCYEEDLVPTPMLARGSILA